MTILVTGSAGHLGEAVVRTLRAAGRPVAGLDIKPSPFTDAVGSITQRDFVCEAMAGITAVVHAATLHKPHVATHAMQDFVDVNVTGTLVLLEAAIGAGVDAFVFTSTTSVFGHSLRPAQGQPAVWVTEDLQPAPRNIYGVTKLAAEDLCRLFHQRHGLACLVLRTSRFFPEADDHEPTRATYHDANVKANEMLYRRADIADVVQAHLLAVDQAGATGFDRLVISATTPFRPEDLAELGYNAPAVLRRRVPEHEDVYRSLGWKMFPVLDRVYDNGRARRILGWAPRHDFAGVIRSLRSGEDPRSPLAIQVGAKGYHEQVFVQGPYPVE